MPDEESPEPPAPAPRGDAEDTRSQVMACADRWYLSGRRVDMRAIAAELGIGRSTLYRAVGNREDVISEILARNAIAVLSDSEDRTSGTDGFERVLTTLATAIRTFSTSPALNAILQAEPEYALRLLTSKAGTVQQRMVRWVADCLERNIESSEFDIDPDLMAYGIVRICESFMYSDVIAGIGPDVDAGVWMIGRILRSGS